MKANNKQTRYAVVCVVLLAIASCGTMGRKYVEFTVTSDPPGATVESIIQTKSWVGGKELKMPGSRLGITPTGVCVVYFAFGAPGTGSTKVGVQVTKDGYETYEMLFDASDWYDSEKEAGRHVKEITISLKKKPIISKDEQQESSEQRQGAPPPEPTIKRADSYQLHELGSFTFQVPINLEVGGPAEEQHIRGMMSVDPRYKITALSTFSVPEGAIVSVYELAVPVGEGINYINKLFDLNVEKFRIGKSGGLVKKVLENRKTKQGSFDALILDWESIQSGLPHSRQWVLHHSDQPADNVAVIVAFCDNHGYRVAKEAIDHIASTLRVRNDK